MLLFVLGKIEVVISQRIRDGDAPLPRRCCARTRCPRPCLAGDDYQALIWDMSHLPRPVEDPILAYTAECEINSLVWSASLADWVTIVFDNKMQILRV